MKIAKIKPLFKSGERDVVSNYRPISILPVFSKLLQFIIRKTNSDFKINVL